MTERWFRWYDGTVRDGKMILASQLCGESVCTVIGVWAALLEDAATNAPRGSASRGIEHHSMFLGLANHVVETVWNALERVGLIKNSGNGNSVLIVNWDRRQFETDAKDPTAKVRKEKWKQRHKKHETERNRTERSGTPESESESESESEKKKKNRKILLPDSWLPSLGHFELGKKEGLAREAVDDGAAEMRSWSLGNGERRRDWDRVFDNWLRRKATKERGSNGPNKSAAVAAGKLAEAAERGDFTFGPRPGLLPTKGPTVVRLLPEGRGARSGDVQCGHSGDLPGVSKGGS